MAEEKVQKIEEITKNNVKVDENDINNRGFGPNLYPEFSRPITEALISNPPGAIEMTQYPKKEGEGKVFLFFFKYYKKIKNNIFFFFFLYFFFFYIYIPYNYVNVESYCAYSK